MSQGIHRSVADIRDSSTGVPDSARGYPEAHPRTQISFSDVPD